MRKGFDLNALKEVLRYAFFGAVTTVLNLILYYCMIKIGMQYLLANVLSFAVAVVISYYFNKKWVFSNACKGNIWNELVRYIGVRVFSIFVDSALLYLAVDFWKQDEIISKVFISGGVILGTYVLNKVYVFGKGKGL